MSVASDLNGCLLELMQLQKQNDASVAATLHSLFPTCSHVPVREYQCALRSTDTDTTAADGWLGLHTWACCCCLLASDFVSECLEPQSQCLTIITATAAAASPG